MTESTSCDLEASLLGLYDLQLLSQVRDYDLASKEERLRSNKDLEALFFRLLRRCEPDLFIEAGAKDAGSSRRAQRMLPEARVVAFEANPYTYRRFESRNSKLEYLHLALDREPGTVTFNVRLTEDGQPSADGQGSLGKRVDQDKYTEVKVTSTSLDHFFVEHPFEACAMWIDVEGAAKQVLAGAQKVLSKASLAIIEVQDRLMWQGQAWRAPEVLQAFYDAGLVPVARDFQSRYQYNVVFVREATLAQDRVRLALAEHWSALAAGRISAQPDVSGAAPSPFGDRRVAKLRKLTRDPMGFVKDSRVYQRFFGNGSSRG